MKWIKSMRFLVKKNLFTLKILLYLRFSKKNYKKMSQFLKNRIFTLIKLNHNNNCSYLKDVLSVKTSFQLTWRKNHFNWRKWKKKSLMKGIASISIIFANSITSMIWYKYALKIEIEYDEMCVHVYTFQIN